MTDSLRILTVDDSVSMRALLKHALASNGFNVVQAEDGQEALDWLAINRHSAGRLSRALGDCRELGRRSDHAS